MKVGVLALQGDVSEHIVSLEAAMKELGLEGKAVNVRRPKDLDGLAALLMPGGESTTIAKQMRRFGLWQPILDLARNGMPLMGTCAGCILLASDIVDPIGPEEVRPMGLLDISVRRNAFGRQAESFEKGLKVAGLEMPFQGVFIRAPGIVSVGKSVEVLASLNGEAVMVRHENIFGLTFHPELTGDHRVHAMFLKTIA